MRKGHPVERGAQQCLGTRRALREPPRVWGWAGIRMRSVVLRVRGEPKDGGASEVTGSFLPTSRGARESLGPPHAEARATVGEQRTTVIRKGSIGVARQDRPL